MRSKLSSLTIKGLILAGLASALQVSGVLGYAMPAELYDNLVKFVEIGFTAIGLATAWWGRVRIGDLK